MTVACELDDAGLEVLINLAAHFRFYALFDFFGVGDAQVGRVEFHPGQEFSMILEDLVETGFLAGDMVPIKAGGALQGGSEGEISGSPNAARAVGRSDGYECEGDFLLFAEADGGDCTLLRMPEDAEVLLHT